MISFIQQVCLSYDLARVVVEEGIFNLQSLAIGVTDYNQVIESIDKGVTAGVLVIDKTLVCFWSIPGVSS